MTVMIHQPQGSNTDRRDGTVIVQSPLAAGTGWYNTANIKIDTYPISVTGLDTGILNSNLSGRFDDPTYYSA